MLFRSANVSHLQHREKFLETKTLYQFPGIDAGVGPVILQAHIASAISDNWKSYTTIQNGSNFVS